MNDLKLNQIFNATLSLTGKVGISGLKMSNIAREANMATGTLYLYFKSKEELLNALYLDVKKVSASNIVSEINHLPINIQLYKMWKTALTALVSNHFRIIFLEQFVASQYISETNKSNDALFSRYLRRLLNDGKKENVIKDINNDMLISLILGYIRNYAFHIVQNQNGLLTDILIDESFALCWNALKK